MKKILLPRLTAAACSLTLLLVPAAQALTPEQAGSLLQQFYVDSVPEAVLNQPSISDMIEALGDPYTQYFTPEEYQRFNASMSDASLVGIGVVFTVTEEGLLLDRVLDASPALEAGLRGGDLILQVDGHSVLGQDSNTVTGWIQGKEGTQVKLVYRRDGQEATAVLTRKMIVIPATTTELLDGHIGYIRCTTFGNETVGHFREGITAYKDQATAWIVDLRSNTGGVTEAATEAAGLFTGVGEMAYLRDGEGEYGAYYHKEEGLTLYPVIVLVDSYTASASEIFASAIRDRGAGIVVGTRTFGKGVAQSVLDEDSMPDFFADGDAIKITSHRFYSPAGNTTDQVGVIPNLLVDPSYTADIAYLLAGADPKGNNQNTLRLDLDWQWYIDLSTAAGTDYRDAFQALLNAVPDNKDLWLSNGSGGWTRSSASAVAQRVGLTYQAPVFPDQEDSDYLTPLSVLKTYGLISGKDDGDFHPSDTLTRAELCQLLASALNCRVPENKSPYTDVSPEAWYSPAVTALSNLGLVTGTGDGAFRPEDTIDHQQFITIMGRLAQRLNMHLYNTAQEAPDGSCNVVGLMHYADWSKASAWLMSYSQKGYLGNTITLLWADAGEIAPTAATTRDEAAYTLYRLLSYVDILPA
ncbi:MAG: S41 family peptidase [Lachnospirales bacterium]